MPSLSLYPNGDSTTQTRSGISSAQPDWIALSTDDLINDTAQWGSAYVYGESGTYEAVGHSFVPTVSQPIGSAKIRISTTGTPSDGLRVRIRSGSMTGEILTTSNTVNPTGATHVLYLFTFPAVFLTAGTKYYWELFRNGARDTANSYALQGTYSAYSDMGYFQKHNGTWTEYTSELQFYLPSNDPVVVASNSGGQFAASLTATPTDFSEMASASIVLRHSRPGTGGDDTKILYAQLFDASGNALSNEMQVYSSTAAYAARDDTVAFTGVTPSTKTVWDGAELRLRFANTQSMGADGQGLQVHSARVDGTYFSAFPVEDTFTDTNGTLLQSHVTDTGHTWWEITNGRRLNEVGFTSTDAQIDSSGRLISDSSTTATSGYLVTDALPATSEVDVLADFVVGSKSALNDLWVVAARSNQASGTGDMTRYFAGYFGNPTEANRKWVISKMVNGTVTELASFAEDLATGTYRVKFEVRDATKKLFVWNGSSWTEKCSTTDNGITGVGSIGVQPPRNVSGNAIDNLTTLPRVPLVETFTDTDSTLLSAHRSESHHKYTAQAVALDGGTATSATAEISSNTLRSSSSTQRSVGYLTDVPFETNEYDLYADFIIGDISSVQDSWVIAARMGGGSWYGFGYWSIAGMRWAIRTHIPGQGSATGVLEDMSPGTYHVKAEIRDAVKKLFVWDDATGWVVKAQTSTNDITQIGSVGIMAPRNASGNAIDNLTTIDPGYVVSQTATMAMIL